MADNPIWNYPLSAAQIAVRDSIPADLAYDVLSTLGMTVSRGDFDRLYGQATLAAHNAPLEMEAELDLIPGAEFIQPRTTVTSTGYLQQTLVTAVNTATGDEIQIPYSIRTDQLISRSEAINAAIASQNLRAPDYNLRVIGAAYTGTYELIPAEA